MISTEDKTKPKPRQKISSQQPDLAKRQRAYELKLRGYSYKAIGAEMGVNPNRAYQFVSEALATARREFTESAGEALQFELNRIERMLTYLETLVFPKDEVPKELDENGAPIEVKLTKTQTEAMFMVDRLLDRKARLLGFYRTDETKVKEPLPWSDDE